MYYNTTSSTKIDYKNIGLPKFAVNYIHYLQVERNLAPGTVNTYATTIQTFLRWIKSLQDKSDTPFMKLEISDLKVEDIANLDRTDIYDFLSFCANDRNNTANSRAGKLSALKSFFNYLCRVGYPEKGIPNPTLEISAPKKEKPVPRFLTLAEAKQMLSVVLEKGNERDYCIVMWFLNCGMRLSELVAINFKDIRKNGDKVDLLIHGKGRKERYLPLNAQCQDALENYLVFRPTLCKDESEQALFVSNQGKRISRRQVERLVEKYLKEANLSGLGISPHPLRHTAATLAYEYGQADIVDVSQQLGHESIAVTQIYIHNLKQNRESINRVGNLLSDT